MAESSLQKLYNNKGDTEPTSSVPSDFEYKEKYEPSATQGIVGLALAGAGAVALRNPIARAINKTIKLKPPKLPEPTPSKEVVDEVSGILAIAPNRTERAQQLVKQSAKQAEAMAIMERSKELKKMAYHNPLSFGGTKKDGIGSSLWDFIARHPIDTARKPKDWIRDFQSKGIGNFKTGNPDFKMIDQGIKRDELWDSNLLQLDKDGRVVGGFLKYADEKNLPLTKMDLLYIVNKAPVNKLVTKRFSTNPKLADEVQDMSSKITNASYNLESKLLSLQANYAGDVAKQEKIKEAITFVRNLNNKEQMNVVRGTEESLRQGIHTSFNEGLFKSQLNRLGQIDKELRDLGVEVPASFAEELVTIQNANQNLMRRASLFSQENKLPKYGSHGDYRKHGGLSYHEDVVYYPEKLPFGMQLPEGYQKHYSSLPNQIYHVRYQYRQGANPNQRIISIDEIQSDYHQKLQKENPIRDKVVNPFGAEVEFFSSNRKLEGLLDEMKQITDKGRNMTKEDIRKYYSLENDFNELKKNTLNLASITERDVSLKQDAIPFLPLYGKENWGVHAIKNTIKQAAQRGDADWVVINPVEQIHHLKTYGGRNRFLGDLEFYGTSTGKAGFKNYGRKQNVVTRDPEDRTDTSATKLIKDLTDPKKEATIPNVMKKLARQYNSEVKTIEVAKSDVNKPFKVIDTRGTEKAKDFGLKPDDVSDHRAAFASRKDAELYLDQLNQSSKFYIDMIPEGDPRLYYKAFGIKITPEMKTKPFKAYQEGGLVVNIFA